jgi:hypothetical protein
VIKKPGFLAALQMSLCGSAPTSGKTQLRVAIEGLSTVIEAACMGEEDLMQRTGISSVVLDPTARTIRCRS